MTNKKLDPDSIAGLAESLHEMAIPDSRAQTVAKELEQLNAAARDQGRTLAYDVDALGFAGVLQRLKRPRRDA